ncbi:helix-turn-helix transcriptional regulator [Neobacillus niacini]|uniref:helix-turn-helix domain-containing protein n=1 Tax=Neobacillus niacini TaxID=86668 RepID=UPI002FFD756C
MLQERLDDIGMTQIQLAAKINKDPKWISDKANNRGMLSIKNAKLIADAVGCHIDDLYEWHFRRSKRQ